LALTNLVIQYSQFFQAIVFAGFGFFKQLAGVVYIILQLLLFTFQVFFVGLRYTRGR
jgi:hypothetical protein